MTLFYTVMDVIHGTPHSSMNKSITEILWQHGKGNGVFCLQNTTFETLLLVLYCKYISIMYFNGQLVDIFIKHQMDKNKGFPRYYSYFPVFIIILFTKWFYSKVEESSSIFHSFFLQCINANTRITMAAAGFYCGKIWNWRHVSKGKHSWKNFSVIYTETVSNFHFFLLFFRKVLEM